MTDDCEAFEIAIERRAHGDLGPEETRALDEHLARCPRCPAFAALVGATSDRLHRDAADAARQVDWPALERRLAGRARRMRRSGWLVPVALLGAAALSLALGLPLRGALLMAGGALVTTALAHRLRTRWLHDLAAAEASREGLLAFSRQQVEAELRAARLGSVALAALAIMQVIVIELVGHPARLSRLAVLGGAGLLLAAAALLALIEAPRLRRERAELT
jgi:anti-sigma factor RsiW